MWELNCKESWVLKNWCFWTVVLEKTLESPLYCKEIQLVHYKGNQSWIFIGRTDAEVETPILWTPDAKNWLIRKDPDSGRDWRLEKGITEAELIGWHHWLNGHEFEKAPGVGDGQGSLECCSPWGCKESDTIKWLNCLKVGWKQFQPEFNLWTSKMSENYTIVHSQVNIFRGGNLTGFSPVFQSSLAHMSIRNTAPKQILGDPEH